jgi:hypothetical protein
MDFLSSKSDYLPGAQLGVNPNHSQRPTTTQQPQSQQDRRGPGDGSEW